MQLVQGYREWAKTEMGLVKSKNFNDLITSEKFEILEDYSINEIYRDELVWIVQKKYGPREEVNIYKRFPSKLQEL